MFVEKPSPLMVIMEKDVSGPQRGEMLSMVMEKEEEIKEITRSKHNNLILY